MPGLERVWIVPGLSLHDGGLPDVMRGEETQIAGAIGQEIARKAQAFDMRVITVTRAGLTGMWESWPLPANPIAELSWR